MTEPFEDLLVAVCGPLDDAGVTYAITGSVVSSIFGEPVTSIDVDICLRMSPDAARKLAQSLPSRFYRDEEAIVDAAVHGGMANLIDTRTHLKVYLSVLPREAYYDSVLARRVRVAYGVGGAAFWTVSPEDIVLMKLIWRRESKSQKQWDNALSVVRAQGHRFDIEYARRWADELGLGEDLHRLVGEV